MQADNSANSAELPNNLIESVEAPINLAESADASSNLAKSIDTSRILAENVESPSLIAESDNASGNLAESIPVSSKVVENFSLPSTSSCDKISTDVPSSKPTGNDVLREEIEKQMDAEINNPAEKELFTNLDEDALLKDGDDSLGFTTNIENIGASLSADILKNNSYSVSDSSSGPNKSLVNENSNKSSEDTSNKDDVEARNESPLPTSDFQENSRDAGPCIMSENSKDGELTKFAHQDVSSLEDTGEPSCSLEVDPFALMIPDVMMEVEEDESGGNESTSNVGGTSAEDVNPRVMPTEGVQSSIHLSAGLGEDQSASKSPMPLESEAAVADDSYVTPTSTEDPEVITGDKPHEAVLDDSLIEDDTSPDKQDACSTIANKDHPYTLPPGGVQDNDGLEIVSESPSKKKKLKIIYPVKKGGKKENEILVSSVSGVVADCYNCNKHVNCIMKVLISGKEFFICSDKCLIEHRSLKKAVFLKTDLKTIPTQVVERVCADCLKPIIPNENNLVWETWEFCNEVCLAAYQNKMGTNCGKCGKPVGTPNIGKYSVRFGYKVLQFCHKKCLEEFKKGIKVCNFCQADISKSSHGFLAAVGEKRQFKDFCSHECVERYDSLSRNNPYQLAVSPCNVCNKLKLIQIEVSLDGKMYKLCSEVCFNAFKFVHVINPGHCAVCKTYFDISPTEKFSIFFEDNLSLFCSDACKNVFILTRRKIAPCGWCKVKKYNFDMIEQKIAGKLALVCSLSCLGLYKASFTAIKSKGIICDMCHNKGFALYHLTMSDATVRNFCGYPCAVNFQAQFRKEPIVIPPGQHKKILPKRSESLLKVLNLQPTTASRISNTGAKNMPVISSVGTLKTNGPTSETTNVSNISVVPPASTLATPLAGATPQPIRMTHVKSQILIRPPPAKSRQNKMTMTRPNMISKGLGCKPHTYVKHCQTDDEKPADPILIPVPVPIYVPVPCAMYSVPCPMPMPFPLPVPVPVFIPTTRNSAKEIMEEIKRIQEKTPSDPLEAELLMMAEMVASENKDNPNSESENETSELPEPPGGGDDGGTSSGSEFSAEEESSNTFGDDMLQMALKMATELDEPHVDIDNALANQHNHDGGEEGVESRRLGRKKRPAGSKSSGTSKKARKTSPSAPLLESSSISARQKPDANMCLKYTFGVNAWKQWVADKNSELEKLHAEEGAGTNVKSKPLNVEILQLTPDELNFALCMFIEEVRKPNGSEYAPDTIFYLCLGIQQYLFLNRRIDNIFYDAYYEKFTNCLDQIVMKFDNVNNDRQYIVTRVEEEHLWECKQLGAHSPHVLLSTLMFFNTKYFNLTTVEEHMELSFWHITKQCKRTPTTAAPGVKSSQSSRNILLRYYPRQSVLDDPNSKKKKVYEQFESENPLRCPVKLYEFYLAKCPESVKSRSDVFYLQPERSCVPDSPVWYSTIPLPKEPLGKMLNRVKMVKEINIALFNS